MAAKLTCKGCGADVHPLAMFPGGLCLPCWTPTGEAEAATMTAEKLTRMWGGPVRRTRHTRRG
jgi:hypothetical protein